MTIQGFTGCGKTTQVCSRPLQGNTVEFEAAATIKLEPFLIIGVEVKIFTCLMSLFVTFQVPQFILDDAVKNEAGCRIAVTQPRRIAAISVAQRVAAERGWELGSLVGYQVGMDRRTSDDTRLTYMTTGVLLQLLIAKKSLGEWTHIIIDEVHERDLETDLLLLVMKKIMVDSYNFKTKVILMSATLDATKFALYFPKWQVPNLEPDPANMLVDCPSNFPIVEYFLEDIAHFVVSTELPKVVGCIRIV